MADNIAQRAKPAVEPISVGIRDAAKLSGLSRSTICELIQGEAPRLRTVKVGRRRLVLVSSLRQMLGG